ncbi:hypothetical protein IC582_018598 [Cucumis melo]
MGIPNDIVGLYNLHAIRVDSGGKCILSKVKPYFYTISTMPVANTDLFKNKIFRWANTLLPPKLYLLKAIEKIRS